MIKKCLHVYYTNYYFCFLLPPKILEPIKCKQKISMFYVSRNNCKKFPPEKDFIEKSYENEESLLNKKNAIKFSGFIFSFLN